MLTFFLKDPVMLGNQHCSRRKTWKCFTSIILVFFSHHSIITLLLLFLLSAATQNYWCITQIFLVCLPCFNLVLCCMPLLARVCVWVCVRVRVWVWVLQSGLTPLHVAAHYDNQRVALLLLDQGASPHSAAKVSTPNHTDSDSHHSLHVVNVKYIRRARLGPAALCRFLSLSTSLRYYERHPKSITEHHSFIFLFF